MSNEQDKKRRRHARPALLIVAVVGLGMALGVLGVPARADIAAGNEAYGKGDYETAYTEWLVEAEAGNPIAQNNIGFMLRKGRGVVVDTAAAAAWYRRAAEQGMADAMTNLGFMLDEGIGVEQDLVESYMWFTLAAERQRERAAEHLEVLKGYMTPEQIAEAVERVTAWQSKPENGAAPAPASGQ